MFIRLIRRVMNVTGLVVFILVFVFYCMVDSLGIIGGTAIALYILAVVFLVMGQGSSALISFVIGCILGKIAENKRK